MKSVSTEFQATLVAGSTALAKCWEVVLSNGVILGRTDYSRDITIANITYLATAGLSTTAIASSDSLDVDNLDVQSFLDLALEQDLDAGDFDNARVQVFEVDPLDVAAGVNLLKLGRLGEVMRRDGRFTAEIRGLTQSLSRKVGRLFDTLCSVVLGDSKCGVNLFNRAFINDWVFATSPDTISASGFDPTLNGLKIGQHVTATGTTSNNETFLITGLSSTLITVAETLVPESSTGSSLSFLSDFVFPKTVNVVDSSAPRRIFSLADVLGHGGTALPSTFFKEGTVRFTSGANLNRTRDIRGQNGLEITCYEEFPQDIQASDTVILEAGCDKLFATCRDKFDNGKRFRGFHLIPLNEDVFSLPVSV